MNLAESYNYRAVIAYDGRYTFGWQRLRDQPTVQGMFEQALFDAFGERRQVEGAGRTDRGAHAEGQVVGFGLSQEHSIERIQASLNDNLPDSIRVREVHVVPGDFHARMSAVGKEYAYLIWNHSKLPEKLQNRVWHLPEPLMIEPMETALSALVGKHDFASFGTKPRFMQKSTVREIFSVEIERINEMIRFRFQGDSFLNHMVRNMVRALVKVGEGRYKPSKIGEILEAKSRAASPGSAPASGLYLMEVFYPK